MHLTSCTNVDAMFLEMTKEKRAISKLFYQEWHHKQLSGIRIRLA